MTLTAGLAVAHGRPDPTCEPRLCGPHKRDDAWARRTNPPPKSVRWARWRREPGPVYYGDTSRRAPLCRPPPPRSPRPPTPPARSMRRIPSCWAPTPLSGSTAARWRLRWDGCSSVWPSSPASRRPPRSARWASCSRWWSDAAMSVPTPATSASSTRHGATTPSTGASCRPTWSRPEPSSTSSTASSSTRRAASGLASRSRCSPRPWRRPTPCWATPARWPRRSRPGSQPAHRPAPHGP